jgi:hypothetical protein
MTNSNTVAGSARVSFSLAALPAGSNVNPLHHAADMLVGASELKAAGTAHMTVGLFDLMRAGRVLTWTPEGGEEVRMALTAYKDCDAPGKLKQVLAVIFGIDLESTPKDKQAAVSTAFNRVYPAALACHFGMTEKATLTITAEGKLSGVPAELAFPMTDDAGTPVDWVAALIKEKIEEAEGEGRELTEAAALQSIRKRGVTIGGKGVTGYPTPPDMGKFQGAAEAHLISEKLIPAKKARDNGKVGAVQATADTGADFRRGLDLAEKVLISWTDTAEQETAVAATEELETKLMRMAALIQTYFAAHNRKVDGSPMRKRRTAKA